MNFKLKKWTAMLALMAGFVFSQCMAKAETTLFDIDFSKDYGAEQNGVYTSAELKALYPEITDQWAGNTSFTLVDDVNGNKYARLTPSSTSNGNSGLKISTGSIKTGVLNFDFKFDAKYASHGGGQLMRNMGVSCNDNSVQFGIPQGEYIHLYPYDKNNPSFRDTTGSFDIRIMIQRADEASDWTVSILNKKDASMPVVLETVLPADSYPTIENFIFYMNWVKQGVTTSWYFYSLKGTHSEIEKGKLEVSENFDVTDDITVIYPENINPSQTQSYELREKGKTDSILIENVWAEENKLVITPLIYLDYDKEYVLTVKGTPGTSGIKYDGEFTLKTQKEDITINSEVLSFLDADQTVVGQENAVGVKSEIKVSNVSGMERELMAVISIYDENGKLLNTNVTPFAKSSEKEIPITVSVMGEESLAGATVKTLILEKSGNGIITVK